MNFKQRPYFFTRVNRYMEYAGVCPNWSRREADANVIAYDGLPDGGRISGPRGRARHETLHRSNRKNRHPSKIKLKKLVTFVVGKGLGSHVIPLVVRYQRVHEPRSLPLSRRPKVSAVEVKFKTVPEDALK